MPVYDALLVVSFGGPEKPADVMPFLENVLRGRNVPRQRMLEVAAHYEQFGGRSPINDQVRSLIRALQSLLGAEGPRLPVYWGNRNWRPMLADALRQMKTDGIGRALAFMTSAFSSYSGCRQYLEDIERARQEAGPGAPEVAKLRVFYNHPGFIEAMTQRAAEALDVIPAGGRDAAELIFTAHSIPVAMAENCRYQAQLAEASRLVSEAVGRRQFRLVYQSRSGPPQQPWLEPDICDYLREARPRDAVIVPIGFLSDHLEVVYDLDIQARAVCEDLGVNMVRAATAGEHPRFIAMIRELILERMGQLPPRALGELGSSHDVCPADCCAAPAPRRAF